MKPGPKISLVRTVGFLPIASGAAGINCVSIVAVNDARRIVETQIAQIFDPEICYNARLRQIFIEATPTPSTVLPNLLLVATESEISGDRKSDNIVRQSGFAF